LDQFGKIDSKFRFVILASKRAKQLLRGAKPRVKSKSRNPIRVAQQEIREGAVDFEIIQSKKDDLVEPEEQVLAVDDGADDFEDAGGAIADESDAPEGEEDIPSKDIDPLEEEFPDEPRDADKEEE
jgi:DNA-directed RNA polymerase omega subunit